MLFYQCTTTSVTPDDLKNAIFNNHEVKEILSFHFSGFNNIFSLDEALEEIDKKRLTLLYPYKHHFLNLELTFDDNISPENISKSINTAADYINSHYDYDLYISSMVYTNECDTLYGSICISNIEKSLPVPSRDQIPDELFRDALSDAFPDFTITPITSYALYVFSNEDTELTYDGVVHLRSAIIKEGDN